MTDEKVEHELGWRIGVMSSLTKALYRTVLVKRGLNGTCLFRFYQSVYVPAVTYVCESWVMTESIKLQIQRSEVWLASALETGWGGQIEVSEQSPGPSCWKEIVRWLRHLVWMPPGHLLLEVFQARPTGRRPRGRPRTYWRDYIYIYHLTWERLKFPWWNWKVLLGNRMSGIPC